MGLILEEDEEGVKIVSVGGAAAQASKGGVIDLCVGDTVVKVGNKDCTVLSFDQIMEAIANESDPVDLTLRRDADAIPVKFLENGVCIAAKPGMSIGALGFMAKADIPYSCRNGGCGTCQHVMVTHSRDGKSKERYVRPCVGKVPEEADCVSIIPCDGDIDSCLLGGH
jgi:ferredoxin